ncbi:hypothetical protein [Deinococcus alpinitundrae]|uniref:hypothetical protein n=1 Tax=Deinococcus alpinitundrae TaxID=468913 RepID=UPI00137B02A3|nr:hypothetical protein [Deinococcus alpinitundrae]
MKKLMLIALSMLSLSVSTLATASAAPALYSPAIIDSDDMPYTTLYTEAAWQSVLIPMSAVGNTIPGDLTLEITGLPEGVTISLSGVSQQNGFLMLSVDTERVSAQTAVYAMANVTVMSGTTALTTFQVPVAGAAYST